MTLDLALAAPTAPTLETLGLRRRLARLLGPGGRAVVVGFDHAVSQGALPGLERLPEVARRCLDGGADGLQVPPGSARWIAPLLAERPGAGLVLRLDRSSYSERRLPEPVRSSAIAPVEEAVRAGADAAVAFFVADPFDAGVVEQHAELLGPIAAACRAWSMPLMVEALAVPAATGDPVDPVAVVEVARIGFEIGADLLKVDHPGDVGAVRELVAAVGAPVLLRGGPRSEDPAALPRAVEQAVGAGAAGIVVGRSVWQAPDPAVALADLVRAVHGS